MPANVQDFRWKDLRHTFAPRLRMQHPELKSIGELMGRTTPRITERYAHAAPDHLLESAQRISREQPAPQPPPASHASRNEAFPTRFGLCYARRSASF